MTYISFQPIGPLLHPFPLYIERGAEQDAIQSLKGNNPNFLMISQPRQQGKTSFINYLSKHPGLNHCWFIIVNAARLRKNTAEAAWYALLRDEIQRQLGLYNALSGQLPLCATQEQWRALVIYIGQMAHLQQRLVVIALDEIGHLPASWREAFLTSLCEMRDSRASTEEFTAVTFLFAGAFRPEDMITDWDVSPFNKAKPLPLEDFNEEQIGELLHRAGIAQPLASILMPRLLYWTDGQPYLVQRLCEILFAAPVKGISPADIQHAVSVLERFDQVHIPMIFEKLRLTKHLCQRAEGILNGQVSEYAPASLKWQAELTSIGLIKGQHSSGHCIIRNPIYARAFRRFLLDQRKVSTPAASASDCEHLKKLEVVKKSRCQQLEIDVASFGIHAPTHMTIELRELRNELANLTEQLAVMGCP